MNVYKLGSEKFLYIYQSRIVRIVEPGKNFIPANLTNVSVMIIYHDIPDYVLNNHYSYSFSMKDNFYLQPDILTEDNIKIFNNVNIKLNIIENFIRATNILKKSIKIDDLYRDLFDSIVSDQINEFKKTGEVGNLLETLKYILKFNDIQSLISYIELQREDISEIFSYILLKRKELNDLLNENKFLEADKIVWEVYNKLKI